MRFLAPVVLIVSLSQVSGSGPAAPLAKEIDRIRALAASDLSTEDQKVAADRLGRASAAQAAGRQYLALYELERGWVFTEAWRFAHASATVTTLDAFDALRKKTGAPTPSRPAAGHRPLFVSALADVDVDRGPATYKASRPYAADAGVESGLYYLGESQAVGRFATFARSLPWLDAGRAPSLRSFAAEIDAFDRQITKAYEGMAPADHQGYIITSVAVKQARALNDQGRFGGALLEYLIARARFTTIAGPAGDVTAPQIADARARLDPGVDHSIAEFFLQMAAGAPRDAAGRRIARGILDDVLPAYEAAMRAPATTTAAPAATQAVTITLVRWPFT